MAAVSFSMSCTMGSWARAGETMEKLFHKARETLPCVLFLDELDTLAGRRSDSGSQHEQQYAPRKCRNARRGQLGDFGAPGLRVAARVDSAADDDAAVG